MNGAERTEAPKAEETPMVPSSPRKKERPRSIPNLGTRLNPTPMIRGINPDILAANGLALNTAVASAVATLGSTALPAASLAYCWTSWR